MSPSINRDWIAAEFSKGIDAEQTLATEAKQRSESPPEPALGVVYHEIAVADERHAKSVETIAIRYGYTHARTVAGGFGEALGRIKERVTESVLGASPLEHLSHDLAGKANAIHWYTAWISAFEALGDTESARELASILTEEKSHHDALQASLNRLVEQNAKGEVVSAK
jgi:hypothetical protein